MKFTVFGAGAIGAYLGGKLSLAGNDVTLIARGPHLAAMQQNGLIIKENGIELLAQPHLAENLNGSGSLLLGEIRLSGRNLGISFRTLRALRRRVISMASRCRTQTS